MRPRSKPWWQQATAVVSLGAGGAITGFSFVPHSAAQLRSPASLPIGLMALERSARPASADDPARPTPTADTRLRSAIVNAANYYLRMARSKSPAEIEALIWRHDSTDGVDHGESCAAFASLTLELASQVVGQPSWVTGGTSYPWPLHSWADARVDPNPASPGIVSLLQDAEAHHRWHPVGDAYQPRPGDWVLFSGHVEVVTGYGAGVLRTIGGDSLPNFSVNAHRYPGPLSAQGVTGFVNNGALLTSARHLGAHRNLADRTALRHGTPQRRSVTTAATRPGRSNVPAATLTARARTDSPRFARMGRANVPATGLAVAAVSPRHARAGGAAIPGLFRRRHHAAAARAGLAAHHRHGPGPGLASHHGPAAGSGSAPYQRHLPSPAGAPQPGTAAQQAFIAAIAPGAIAAQHRYGVPAAVTIAQAIDESGWGQSLLATRDHNLFGIKGSGPAGSDVLPTQEYLNGQYVSTSAAFGAYHTVGESIDAHGRLLATSGYYGHAMSLRHDPDAFASALTGVYATDPNYGSTLIGLMRQYHLYRFDAAAHGTGPAAAAANASASATGGAAIPGLPRHTPAIPGRTGAPRPSVPPQPVGRQPTGAATRGGPAQPPGARRATATAHSPAIPGVWQPVAPRHHHPASASGARASGAPGAGSVIPGVPDSGGAQRAAPTAARPRTRAVPEPRQPGLQAATGTHASEHVAQRAAARARMPQNGMIAATTAGAPGSTAIPGLRQSTPTARMGPAGPPAVGGAAIPGLPHRPAAPGRTAIREPTERPAGPAQTAIPGLPHRPAAPGETAIPGLPHRPAAPGGAAIPGLPHRRAAPGAAARGQPPASRTAGPSAVHADGSPIPGTAGRGSAAALTSSVGGPRGQRPAAVPRWPVGAAAAAPGQGVQPTGAAPAPAAAMRGAASGAERAGAAGGATAGAGRAAGLGGTTGGAGRPAAVRPPTGGTRRAATATVPEQQARLSGPAAPAQQASASRPAAPAQPASASRPAAPAQQAGASPPAARPQPTRSSRPATPAPAPGPPPAGAGRGATSVAATAITPSAEARSPLQATLTAAIAAQPHPGAPVAGAAAPGAPVAGAAAASAPAPHAPAPGAAAPARLPAARPIRSASASARYQQHMPPAFWKAFLGSAKVPLVHAEPLYVDVASHTGIAWEILAACDWMQCKAQPGRSPVHGEKLGAVNADGSVYRTKSAALEQCAFELAQLGRTVYALDLTERHLSVRDLANVFAAFRWGGLLKLHRTSAMEFPYSVAGLTPQHLHMRWPNIDEPDAPDRPGSRFRPPFGAVPVVLGLGYPATV